MKEEEIRPEIINANYIHTHFFSVFGRILESIGLETCKAPKCEADQKVQFRVFFPFWNFAGCIQRNMHVSFALRLS